MQGRRNLAIFAVRALAVLIAVSLVWVALADPYNEFLVDAGSWMSPDQTETRVFDSDILYKGTGLSTPVTVRGLTLHWGLVLIATLVASVTGISLRERAASLLGLGALVVLTHVLAVGLLPHGYVWVAEPGSPSWARTLVEGLYSVYWGLAPAMIAGVWALRFWLRKLTETQKSRPTHEGQTGTSNTGSDPA
jgi:hypothetical protein